LSPSGNTASNSSPADSRMLIADSFLTNRTITLKDTWAKEAKKGN
jgi:hypothetical protein